MRTNEHRQRALARLAAANPVAPVRFESLRVHQPKLGELLDCGEQNMQVNPAWAVTNSRVLRPRRVLLLLAAVAAIVTGVAAAAATWLAGEPAPPSVISDFNSYSTQLGFHPQPGKAVLVATDNDISLYATLNEEGSYCVIVSEPWKRPATLGDGGSCIPPAQASSPLTAWLLGVSAPDADGKRTYVFAGRVADDRAQTIRVVAPGEIAVERHTGEGGFFVGAMHLRRPCSSDSPTATVSALSQDRRELASKTVALGRLVRISTSDRACPL
jgi:hypothetical protein